MTVAPIGERMFKRVLSLALFVFVWFAGPLTAQEPAVATPAGGLTTLKISTRIVVLDVVVTDKKGNLVTTGLGKDDFTIVEDKAPQTILSFDEPSAHALPVGVQVTSAADLKKIGDAPVTVLVLDELNTRFEDMVYSRNAMIKYLQAQPAVLKQPTVLLLATNTRFVQMHDYTQNRDELIDQIKHRMPEYPTKMMAGRGGAAAVERMAQSLAALEQIAQASNGTPGRKNVIWVGNGFPSADLVGLDPPTAATIEAAVRQCTDMLLAARITMYTINPTLNSTVTLDVETPEDLTSAESDTGGELYSGAIQFSTFAPATGGRSFLSRNDINNEIAEGIAAGSNYYTMSYAPTNKSDDAQAYRNIRIVMKDPNLRATTRNGYYPQTAATMNIASTEAPKQAKAQLTLDLSNAVNSAISYNGLDVKATHVGDVWVLQVKSAGLDWRSLNPQQDQTEVTVMAAWYTDKGKLLGHASKELTANRAAGTEAGAVFSLPVAVSGDPARLRFVVRDASNGHMGTVDVKP
jgi:VWFA-related protein